MRGYEAKIIKVNSFNSFLFMIQIIRFSPRLKILRGVLV